MERSVSSGQFVLQEKLNESATTAVYKAHQDVLGRTVLLKILHKHLADDPVLVERFKREARACALIRSDDIVQVYDLTEIDGAPAIVMEFVEGTSLKDVLADEGPMSAERTRTIALETLSALKAAHQRGVIHRDIKPGNMLVTESGRIKVTDFGLAAVAAWQTVTMEGAVLGTPAYLPPEHIRGEAADERSDLFSLGATLLEVNTGRRIFEGPTYSACIHNILQFDPAVIDTLVADRLLAEVLKKMMQPDRAQRYQSAAEALEALSTGTKDDHPYAKPSQPSVRPFRWRLPAIALFFFTLALIGASAYWRSVHNDVVQKNQQKGDVIFSIADSSHTSIDSAPRETAREARPRSGETEIPNTQMSSRVVPQPATGMQPATTERDSARLVVTCIPWAKIFLDSQYLGETPIGGAIPVRSGMHTVSFTNPQFMPIVKMITAPPGAQITVAGNFLETVGYIAITVKPWAEVYIDDQYRDTTPIDKPMPVTAGTRRIRLHNPGFTDAVYDIAVPKKDTVRLSYSLTRIR
jgi:serine/threonine protein kinase